MEKLRVGILGATGFVGQRFVTLLENHPYFEVCCVAASSRSAGVSYYESVADRWKLKIPMPEYVKDMCIEDVYNVDKISAKVDIVFCAIKLNKEETRKLEEAYAKHEIPVISNNSACRSLKDVPVIIPEINEEHFKVIETQKKRLGTKRGFIVTKPNCSVQSYLPALTALRNFKPNKVVVSTYQAISGAGKTFKDFPDILDNVIPFISGEEEKSEIEPLKIWGSVENGIIVPSKEITITSQCIRVPVIDGHLASVFVSFEKRPSKDEILECFKNFKGKPQLLELPTAPKQFLTYFNEEDRPQTKLDRNLENGMGISIGRLREDSIFDYKFVCLSHNSIRGAAGGALLTAELLYKEGFI